MYFLIFLTFNFYYAAFPVWAAEHLHWTIFKLGIFFSFLSAVLVVVQGPVLSVMSSKISDAKLVIGGSVILSIAFLFFRSDNTVLIYCGALFFGIGNGLMWPSFSGYTFQRGPRSLPGRNTRICKQRRKSRKLYRVNYGRILI